MEGLSVSDFARAILVNGLGAGLLYVGCFAAFPAKVLMGPMAITAFMLVWTGLAAYQLTHLRKRRQRLAIGGKAALPSLGSQQAMKAAFSTPAIVLYAVSIAGTLAVLRYLQAVT
jgi:hypothetical protein